ncbi:MAG: hypothetical protein WBZ36_22335 [Candidatus Nitrosopolaris sp.]
MGIDWNRRFSRYESTSSLRYYKIRDSGSENSITSDIDENRQSEFWARAMEEKEKRHQELQTIEQQWEVIEQERQENVQMREWVEEQKINLKSRENKLAELEPLIPSVKQLQQMGVTFNMTMSYIE